MADPTRLPPPAAPAPAPAAPDEAEPAAWAQVEVAWEEKAAHLAYLARFPDLDGLTAAGRRYRDVLAARPGDAMALTMKAEIVKRATVVGLSMLPRSAPPSGADPRWKKLALRLLAAWLGSALAYFLWKLLNGPAS